MRFLFAALLTASGVLAQAPTGPVITARGITNYFTQQPAPSNVAPGGLIQITGLNLGPVDGATASGLPWPTGLADVQVVVGGRPAPLYSVSPGTILAQVPYDSNLGLVDVIVQRGSARSRAARVNIVNPLPSVRTADDSGAGAPWGVVTAKSIATTATGLGPTTPRMTSGDAAAADTKVNLDISAYIGGLSADVTATPSTRRPGEFDINITVPDGARPGDIVNLMAGQVTGNLTVFQPATAIDVQAVRLPDGAPDLVNLTDTGLNGNFLVGTAARGPDGCTQAFVFDMVKKSSYKAGDCFISVNPQIPPMVVPPNGNTVAGLVGPSQGDAQTGISSKVQIFRSGADPIQVTLSSPASLLAVAAGSDYAVTLPGATPPLATLNSQTGEVKPVGAAGAAGGAGGAGAGAGGGLGGVRLPQNFSVDGLSHVYTTPVALAQNRYGLLIGDDANHPKKAEYAIVSNTGDLLVSKPFPDGWLPLLGAARAGANGQVAAGRAAIYVDNTRRFYYAVARATDSSKDGFIAFAFDNTDPKAVPLPDGWFASSCVAAIRVMSLDLSRQLAVVGSRVAETDFKAACTGMGYLTLDLTAQTTAATPLPGQAQVLASGVDEMNDYVYGNSVDPTRAATSDTLYVMDGANQTLFTLRVPADVVALVDATIRQVPELNTLIATSNEKVAGDHGLLVFNLDLQSVKTLDVPAGFTSVTEIDDNGTACCLATRKIVAHAFKQNGSNLVVYNLATNEFTVVENPQGVTSVGPLPRAAQPGAGGGGGGTPTPPGGGGGGTPTPPGGTPTPPGGTPTPPGGALAAATAGQMTLVNPRANTVSAVAYGGAQSRQVGVVVVRIP